MLLKQLKRQADALDRRYLQGRLFLWKHSDSRDEYRRIRRMNQRPVIIGGCGRSGTTLLLSLLSCHPAVFAIPKETCAFCWPAYPKGPDADEPFRLRWLYGQLIGQTRRKHTRWCEKTPKNVHYISRLIDYFGEGARFLNIVRDGRDVVTSRHPEAEHRYWVSPVRWVEDVSTGRKREDHPQVLTVKYEDLVNSHSRVLRRICRFIEEEFHPEAFNRYPASATVCTSSAWVGKATEVHSESTKRWKRAEHNNVVQRLLGTPGAADLLKHYGYIP